MIKIYGATLGGLIHRNTGLLPFPQGDLDFLLTRTSIF
jgi:hypothetical protein